MQGLSLGQSDCRTSCSEIAAAQFVLQLRVVVVQNQKDLQWCKTQNISKTEPILKYLKMVFILMLQKNSAAAVA